MKFTGRSRELGALRQLLDRPEPQLVRVTGLPGVGKSAGRPRTTQAWP
jgi:AAA+ ATPase superfamily predicted ATPase